MGNWWKGLDRQERDWFILSGFLMLLVVGLVVGIVAATNVAVLPTLVPLILLGFSAALAGLLGAFISAMIRLA